MSNLTLLPHQTKLPYQIDSDAALLPYLIHRLGSAHEWSGVWTGPKERCYLKISHIIFLDHLLLRNPRTLLAQLLIKKRKRISNQLLMTTIVIKNNLWINLIRRLRKKVSTGRIINFEELFPSNKIISLINRNKQIDPTNQFVYFFNLI